MKLIVCISTLFSELCVTATENGSNVQILSNSNDHNSWLRLADCSIWAGRKVMTPHEFSAASGLGESGDVRRNRDTPKLSAGDTILTDPYRSPALDLSQYVTLWWS
jgi:hypothetical protein